MSYFAYFHEPFYKTKQPEIMTAKGSARKLAKLSVLFFMMVMVSNSCKKEEQETGTGYVLNSGSYQNGGCEWIIELNLRLYKPRNLPSQFQVDSLPVSATFTVISEKVDCPTNLGFSGTINLNKISPI